ncbi:hypothetical protein IQ265_09790 [Nodosilinea sp. LEGE 06152]|uniref:hypothetical protein n=1 Tax=Nodosilinea sp. LEGE 06152 TaxID=2777966 RepID=UPI001881DD58|nr:hypothetical protein [Nodosilinea sp. LEGE 06152]MBE9157114.1 hypothetical protein [Nodosilinea sp. LEGE 06152]
MTSIDDLTLLQWFVSGDAILEANPTLRVQPANNLRQLLGRKGLLLATAYDATTPPRIEVRRSTEYTDVLHQVLIDHQFMPVGQGLDSQVLCYTYSPIPQGYRINYTEARQLWKQWWMSVGRLRQRNLQLDLFVLTQNQWYPVRDIAVNSGTLYIETLRGETVHQGGDMVVWLEKDSGEEPEKTQVWAGPGAKVEPVPTAAAPPPPPQPTASPTLASVVQIREGKIYVKTALGVVVIEGDNLKAYGLEPRAAAVGVGQR